MIHYLVQLRPLFALLIVSSALLSARNDSLIVHGFAPIQRRSGTSHPGRPAVDIIASGPQHQRGLDNSAATTFGTANPAGVRRGGNRHQLTAVPASLWWILGHTTLPFFGLPFVIHGTKEGGWYRKIDLPPWTPPNRLFGPVWTALYTCMGLAVSRICKLSSPSSLSICNPLVQLWLAHFAVNLAWPPIFFGLQRFRLGLIISYLLVGSLAAIIPLFHAVDPVAAFLLVPYGMWLSFATFGLNTSICRRNPTKNGYNEGMFQAQLQKLQDDAAAYAGV